MRQFRIILAVVLTLGVGGCAAIGTVLDITSKIGSGIVNPVSVRDLDAAENAYGIAVAVSVNYRRYCWNKPLADFTQVQKVTCTNRRGVVRQMQASRRAAKTALVSARSLVLDNPTITPVSAISLAIRAVGDFQRITDAYKGVQ